MIRAGLYIRVSHEEQVLHGLSLESQKEALTAYAKQHNMQIVDVYADEGITARKALNKRLQFQRLISDVKAGKIDLILVTKLDRWFRNIKDYHNTQEILEKHNCNWRTIYESYDTSTSSGRLHINIMLSVNQDECDRTSERIKAVFEHKKNNKEATTGAMPLGYKVVDKKIVKDEAVAHIVNDIFDYFEMHNNKNGTVNYINDKYGTKYHYNTIARMLKKPIYKGEFAGIEGFCEPYLTNDRWYKIQGLTSRNIKVRHNERVYTYSGLLICKECGLHLAGCSNKYIMADGTIKYYKHYRCTNAVVRKWCSHNLSIREDVIDKFIVANLVKELENYKVSYDINAKQVDYTAKRNKLERKIARLKDLYINELITLDEYKADLSKFNSELDKIPTDTPKVDLQAIQRLLDMDIEHLYYELTYEERQVLIRSVIKQINVDAENKMELVFN
jgi:DNA invertase Pin-like site-specific DNA recombinase